MPVSGKELASLDFANLIGGPLNAIVEAQAKSAISTVNFIKEVGFDKEGKVINTEFKYNRKNDDGSDQEFCLTVPFLTLLPVPYITIHNAVIEFNAKITSTTESKTESNFDQEVKASASGGFWFMSAKVQSKTAYQKKSSSSDREERSFDMHVRVEASNQDMPAGTERILTILENSIQEKSTHKLLTVGIFVKNIVDATGAILDEKGTIIVVEGENVGSIAPDCSFEFDGVTYNITDSKTETDPSNHTTKTCKLTLHKEVTPNIVNKNISIVKPKVLALA